MAAISSIYVNCPVCGESLEVPVTLSRVAHSVKDGDDLVVRCTLFIAPLSTWTPSADHASCFALSDADMDHAVSFFRKDAD